MPQVFRVVKCYKCNMYQVDIVKKAKKWQCKLCGEKQSVIFKYGIGTSKECRLQVQKLNLNHSNNDRIELEVLEGINEDNIINTDFTVPSSSYVQNSQANKWDALVDTFSDDEEENQYECEDKDRLELGVPEGINKDHSISKDSTDPSFSYVQAFRQVNKWNAFIDTTSDEKENPYEDEVNDRLELEVHKKINEDHIISEDSTVPSSSYLLNSRQANKWDALIDTFSDEEENQFEKNDNINRTGFENLTVPNKKREEKFKPLKRLLKVPEGQGSRNKISIPNGLHNFVLTKNRTDSTQEVLISPRSPITILQSHEQSKPMWNTSIAEFQEASSDDDSYFDKIPEFV